MVKNYCLGYIIYQKIRKKQLSGYKKEIRDTMGQIIFSIIVILMISIDTEIIRKVFKNPKGHSEYFAKAAIASIITSISYLVSILTDNYLVMKIACAFYFTSIDIMLLFLLIYIIYYSRYKMSRVMKFFLYMMEVWIGFDIIVEFINPFKEIAMEYREIQGAITRWQYSPKLLYQMHLILSYTIIAAIFYLLIRRMMHTSAAYRQKYYTIIAGIMFVVALNGVFLFIDKESRLLDYSIIFYGFMIMILYWNTYYYSKHGMLNHVRQMILDEIEHPIVLFDEEKVVALSNYAADVFVGEKEKMDLSMSDFVSKYDLDEKLLSTKEDNYFLWNYSVDDENVLTFRVDFHILRDKKNRIIGRMFVFTDNSLEIDILTGFQSKNSFQRHMHTDYLNI